MTREEKENLLREAVDILIKLDNHLMTSRDNAEFSSWVEDLIDNYCEEEPKTGHWTVVSDGYGDNAYICECSECKDTVWVYKDADRKWNYCPDCGAKMIEPQESNDKCKNCEYSHNPDYTRCHECRAESEE